MDPERDRIAPALTLAACNETDGIAFYRKAAAAAKAPMARLMFESLVRDEENHLAVIDRISRELLAVPLSEVFAGTPRSRVRSVFEANRADLEQRFAALPGETEVLRLALEMEDRSHRQYIANRESTADPGVRDLFDRLAAEEREHYAILAETLAFLEDTGNWFIYGEHGNMDGG
jgi:rubrerythrin